TNSFRRPLLLFLIAAACSNSDERSLRIIKGEAVRGGIVTGFVVDDEAGGPGGAGGLVGAPRVPGTAGRAPPRGRVQAPARAARPGGSSGAPATAGRVRVEVRSDGYLKTFRDVVAGAHSLPMPFKVAARAPKVAVGPSGGQVTFRGASLQVAANTFVTDTKVA